MYTTTMAAVFNDSQAIQQFRKSRTAPCRMGAKDAGRSTAEVERDARHTGPLHITAHMEESRRGAHQSRKVSPRTHSQAIQQC